MGRFIQGTKVRIFIAPLILCKRYVPADQTISVDAATSGANNIVATGGLTADLSRFSTLTTTISGVTRYLYVDADVFAGDTNIPIKGLNFDLPASTLNFTAKQPIANTTESGFELTANAQEFYFLNEQGGSFKDETTVTGEWSIPVTTNVQLETPSHVIMSNCAVDLIENDREVYVWIEYPPSSCVEGLGFTGRTSREGVACVMEYNEQVTGDNIVTVSATLSGRGAVTVGSFYDAA
ncbi:MAG: hypothetical protein QNJ54_16230 [Prochloraceae cyanobacterium]|nr:hypothetical protein [Prochloraceae cyanobacterium]